ncbi:DeoR family glycerol-3-phosphate regulon repressor [Chitinivorax tropicus]|uniref:DeoR family glycerol-3-phosphate regulon repressor n=1 Tax=Chitinivorax tropicus TaxID=714531 RepID=A0A840MK06_9PROT|nr:DeoR family transcriptional regulator [Chitinivorax tropicus]MBB5017032.1 DeoR family glycerol-3-phosphate regulon repressor [Chitinivorax tropicus]
MRQPRHEKIVQLVKQHGYMSIETLAKELDVTPQTIRRDINMLAESGVLKRFHGGAGNGSSVQNEEYAMRKVWNQTEKERIAKLVAANIPDNASLIMNIGTTVETVARALLDHKSLRIITNNLNVASIFGNRQDFEVIIAGGVVRPVDGGIIGEATIDFIRQFKVDFAVIGISGIDDDGTLLDFDYREVRVAQAIVEHARQIFLVADHGKFGRNAMVRMGHVSQVTALFTDQRPSERLVQELEAAETALYIAE